MPHEDCTMIDCAVVFESHPFAEHLTHREAEDAWKWLKTLTQAEWDLLRRSPHCVHCGHLLVLRQDYGGDIPEAEGWAECRVPSCLCTLHDEGKP